MSREQKIARITRACVKANPEIVELKFGCEMRRMGFQLNYVGKNNGQHALLITEKQELLFVGKIEEAVEILGRPIRLADVLLAIKEERTGVMFHLQYDGLHFAQTPIPPLFWNLRKDSLTDQSDPTIDFIDDLLDTTPNDTQA